MGVFTSVITTGVGLGSANEIACASGTYLARGSTNGGASNGFGYFSFWLIGILFGIFEVIVGVGFYSGGQIVTQFLWVYGLFATSFGGFIGVLLELLVDRFVLFRSYRIPLEGG